MRSTHNGGCYFIREKKEIVIDIYTILCYNIQYKEVKIMNESLRNIIEAAAAMLLVEIIKIVVKLLTQPKDKDK